MAAKELDVALAKFRCVLSEFESGTVDGEWIEKIMRDETTVGRALLSKILPKGLPFKAIDTRSEKERNFQADQRIIPSLWLDGNGYLC